MPFWSRSNHRSDADRAPGLGDGAATAVVWRWVAVALLAAVPLAFFLLSVTRVDNASDEATREVRLSDVHALLDAGVVEKADIDEASQQVAVWVADEGRAAALAAARRLADEDGRGFEEVDSAQTLVVSAGFVLAYGDTLTQDLLDAGIPLGATPPEGSSLLTTMLPSLIPIVLIGVLLWYVLYKQGMIGGFGGDKTSKVKVPATRFGDVAGVDEAVEEVGELVGYLHDPSGYGLAGARPPRGVLLEGPPGTGKTLLARAVAGEAGAPFFAISGSDFVEVFAGVGARRVRELFKKARDAGRAVVFIDEIDAIGRKRSAGPSRGGNEEREQTLNQLLVEMDGFSDDSEVIVMAATNRADLLDDALTRPGRFDRRVAIPAPDRGGRTRILEVHARAKTLADDVDLVGLARRTPGMTGAELENLVNTAAVTAARDGRGTITAADMEAALQTVAMGKARTSALITERDRTITAWHEAGHAVAALVQPDTDDPVTVSIIPRGPAGGVTWMAGNDRQFTTRSEAKARLAVCLAGRAAEELLLDGDFTQGAGDDLRTATDLAFRMVAHYGMAGGLTVYTDERYQAGGSSAAVDAAVERLLAEALELARRLLQTHHATLERLVELLLKYETVAEQQLRKLTDRDEGDDASSPVAVA